MNRRADWLEKGERCWACDEKSADQPYRKAVVQTVGPTKTVCRFEDGHTEELRNDTLEPRTASSTLHQDLMEIDKLNNAELLYHLRSNFETHNIYTYVGSNLLVVNPYKFYPQLYGQELQHFYIEKVTSRQPDERLPPHVYAVACEAIRNLQLNNRSQSILISGESGAGKTEANKEVLRLIAKYYGVGHHGIEEKIGACNPLLQAFGNAKTIRNDNSSRFGKFIEMQVNRTTNSIHQARILNYLLEKSRLISQSEGERNFHIFYYFLKGLTAKELAKFGVTAQAKLDTFGYLKGTSFQYNDDKMLAEVRSSLKILPFPDAEECVWRIIAAILHLGNVAFREVTGAKCEATNLDSLKQVCQLLEVSLQSFTNSLTTYRIKVSSEVLDKHFTVSEIKEIRDSLSKALYERLFSWLVFALNKSFETSEVISEKQRRSLLNIGLLDIYGFEVLKSNSFEQLCINFTNEKLHQLYITDMFKAEKAVFQAEGLAEFVQTVEFKDNEPLLDMLDSNSLSVFNLLDEWCSVASPDEQSFLTKVRFHHKKNEYFPQVNLNTTNSSLFIRHTPREVQYNVTLFKEKNKNQLRDDVHAVLRESKLWLVQAMFPPEQKEAVASTSSSASKMKKFIGSRFRFEINKLTSELQSQSELHFIRCIKSNNTKEPEFLDDRVALQQIRYLSVLESIQMRRRSYCVRISYQQFCERFYWYTHLMGADKATPRELTMKTMKTHFPTLTKEDLLFGSSKIFMKDYVEYRLNLAYRKRMTYLKICAHRVASAFIGGRYLRMKKMKEKARSTIRNFLESFRSIRYLSRLKQAVRTIERYWLKRTAAEDQRKKRYDTMTLQTYFRRVLEYRKRARKLSAVGVIEIFYKKHLLRSRLLMYMRVQLSIRDILDQTMSVVADRRVLQLERYFKTFSCMVKNRERIRQSIRNEMLTLRSINSRTIEKYVKGMAQYRATQRFLRVVVWMQRQYKTKVCRRNFLSLRNSIVRIQRAYREFYFRKVESHRIFTQFFEAYNRRLIAYNDQVRTILFGERKSKQEQGHVEDILKSYLAKYHTKMTLFYYLVDFEAHIDLSDVYPADSWLDNYLRVYREGFEKYTPMQQLQVGETMTVAATNNRLYSWGSLVESTADKIAAVPHKGVLTSYRLRKDTLQVNQIDPVVKEATSKKQFRLSKHSLTQLIKENPIPLLFPKGEERKVLEVSCGNAHTICRTSARHVYTWGYGVNGQLGHGLFYSEEKPRCVEFFSVNNQLVQAIQVAATYSSSVVLMSNRKVFWFGRNGTLHDVSTPVELLLHQKGRLISNPEAVTPLKLVVSWSKTMSVVGLTFLSYNGVLSSNLTLRSKLTNLIIAKWHAAGIELVNPPYTHNIANYLSEASIKLPASRQPSEMESRRALRDLEEEIRSVLRDDSMEISFSFDNPLFK